MATSSPVADICSIARRTGLARNTVKKYLLTDETEPTYARRAAVWVPPVSASHLNRSDVRFKMSNSNAWRAALGRCLQFICSVQQQGAQVSGVFEVVRLQMDVAAKCICHFVVVVRVATHGPVLVLF